MNTESPISAPTIYDS